MSDSTQAVDVVTGVTSGLGAALFEQLAAEGGPVIAVSRSGARTEAMVDDVAERTGNSMLHLVEADLSLLADVREAAAGIETICAAAGAEIGRLVLNAATLTKKSTLTSEGNDTMWAVNFLGVAELVWALEAVLRRSACAQVCVVSSDAHRWVDDVALRKFLEANAEAGQLSPMKMYGVTKLAGLVFFHWLAREWPEVKITAHHPGFVSTNLGLKGAWPLRVWWRLSRWRMRDPGEAAAEILSVEEAVGRAARELRYWEKGEPHPLPPACQAPGLVELLIRSLPAIDPD